MSEWETFCDPWYYYLWRVRRKNERGFNDGYHIHNREEARALVDLLNSLERERDEALAYADKLAAGLPEGMLPKDVEVLRDANLALAVERDALQEQLDAALNAHDERCMEVEDAKRALGAIHFEGIRMASMRVKDEHDSLQEQLDAAIMLGKMQERRHERELEQVREQYRLSSVCRKLMIENQKLKWEQP